MNLDVYPPLFSVSTSSVVFCAWASPNPSSRPHPTSQQRIRVSSLPDALQTLDGPMPSLLSEIEEAIPAGNINIHNAQNINFSISTSPPNIHKTFSTYTANLPVLMANVEIAHGKKHCAYYVQEFLPVSTFMIHNHPERHFSLSPFYKQQ